MSSFIPITFALNLHVWIVCIARDSAKHSNSLRCCGSLICGKNAHISDSTASVVVTRAVAIAPKVHLYTGMVGGESKRLRMQDTNSDAEGKGRAAGWKKLSANHSFQEAPLRLGINILIGRRYGCRTRIRHSHRYRLADAGSCTPKPKNARLHTSAHWSWYLASQEIQHAVGWI
jgi:hypothetical protein